MNIMYIYVCFTGLVNVCSCERSALILLMGMCITKAKNLMDTILGSLILSKSQVEDIIV
jgi:hypothetical protein